MEEGSHRLNLPVPLRSCPSEAGISDCNVWTDDASLWHDGKNKILDSIAGRRFHRPGHLSYLLCLACCPIAERNTCPLMGAKLFDLGKEDRGGFS